MLVAHTGGKSLSGTDFLGHWCRFVLAVSRHKLSGYKGSHWLQRSSSDVIVLTSRTVDHRPSLLCSFRHAMTPVLVLRWWFVIHNLCVSVLPVHPCGELSFFLLNLDIQK